jgi:hypothetical protein
MSIAAIWDRFWWSLMLAIFVGLVWLKFMDPLMPHSWIGTMLTIGSGAVKFALGIFGLLKQKRKEEEIERKAREELIAEFGTGAVS